MGRLSFWPAILGIALAMIVVTIIEPVRNSMAYAAAIVVIIGLIGWITEARAVAGPPPEVEPEHEEEEQAPGPSYWPVVLSLGIVGIAAGIVYDFGEGALIVALPLAAWAAAAWANIIKGEQEATATDELEPAARPLVTATGTTLMPVQPNMLVAQAAGGAAIAIERSEAKEISRRGLLATTFWVGLGAGLLAFAGALVDFLYPRGITGFGSVILAGNVSDYEVGVPTANSQGKFWMVNLPEEEGGPGFLALWWKCPHLGCTVPWRETFSFTDPQTGASAQGWFRCPCHGSTYTMAGVRVFGPAPRSMDRMEVTIDGGGNISVNTGAITKGTIDNPNFAVQA
jgi:cytochrome b6-f complex iron-sulfur subunit